jgi:signal transduction histidine kinase
LIELREMARGIHPAILSDEGLESALGFHAERSPVAVQLDINLRQRFPPEVEATAYFVVSESLTNAAKHADASSVAVSANIDSRRLVIDIVDHGRGGADGHWGSGLQGLADRLATLDGHLTVMSPAGVGTVIHADIPCG